METLLNILILQGIFLLAQGRTIGETEYVFEWDVIDYDWPSDAHREEALLNGDYIPSNNIIAGVKVYNDDVFITIPRWLPGVPSTMNKVIKKDGKDILQPFPSWEMQEQGIGNCDKFQFTQSMEIIADSGEMWIIDRGSPVGCGPKLIILDMHTGEVLHHHDFPASSLNQVANFVNDIAVDPDTQVAYMSDVGVGPIPGLHEGGIIVFDRATDSSHRLEHESMKSEPGGGYITINGVVYDYNGSPTDGIALSPDRTQLYWCPLGGFHLWQMPSADARDPEGVNLDDVIRDLGPKASQTDGMVMGHKGIYFGALSLNAIYMWEYQTDMADQDASLTDVTMETQTRLVQDNQRMIWPDTFGMDGQGWLWCTPNMLPQAFARAFNSSLYPEIKFRVSRTWVDDVSYLDPAPTTGSSVTTSGSFTLALVAVIAVRQIGLLS